MKRLLSLLCVASVVTLFSSAFAAPATVAGFTFVKTAGGISEYRCDANGLQVLLLPEHSAPVVTFMVTYRVGSRNEVTGTTGATHLLEHLMFKGSTHFNDDLGTGFDKVLDRIGAINNATTWLDRTNYYENLASDRLELAVQLEADRMRGLRLREEDRAPEMTVVRNEFERGENDPTEALDKEIGAVAFIAHPYHHPTIGWRSDIEKVSIGKLREFYNTYYWPNNATVTIIGDFAPDAALALLQKYYGAIPASPQPIPEVYTEEPPQQGPRRVTVKRPGELGVVGVSFKVPGALHADHPALVLLVDVLTDGKNSRLYRALTDKNLTIDVSATKGFFRDQTLLSIYARLAPGSTHAQVEQALLAELARVKAEGVTAEEVARAISKETADTAYGRDGSFAIAGQLNEHIAVGDWTYYVTLPEKLKKVTAAEVSRVAQAYLVEDQSTTGWFIPQSEAGAAASASAAAGGAARRRPGPHPEYYRAAATEGGASASATGVQASATPKTKIENSAPVAPAAQIAPKIVRRRVAGADVLTYRTALQDVVTIHGSLPAGDVFNPAGRPAVADLTVSLLDKGTRQHDKFALAQLLEDVGATIHFGSTAQNVTFSARCLKKDASRVLGLLVEQLRAPAFAAEELTKAKKQLAGQFKQQMEDTNFRARQAFARAIFPAEHPNCPPENERYLADIENVTEAEVRAFHAAHYGPAGLTLVAVGDVDDTAIDTALGTALAGWTGGAALPAVRPAPALTASRVVPVNMAGKTSVSVLLGQPSGLKYSDPDRIALATGTAVLGGNYFSSRLLAIVRAKEGLTYGIGARLAGDTYTDGQWAIQSTFAPQRLEKGLAATRRELARFVADGVTAEELRDFQAALTGTYKLALATSGGMAEQILTTVQRGLPLSFIDEYPRTVEALTLAQVNGAIRKYLDPEKFITVQAGTLPTTKTP
ncbi:MAG: insulinase family protein [Opitutae bacterium]|nr:insulinase family protein [Opitutae bacterium]